MVEKRIANSGGQTEGIDGSDETAGTVGIDGKIATDPMQSLSPGYWLCFLSKPVLKKNSFHVFFM